MVLSAVEAIRQEGLEEGLKKGLEKGRQEVAANLLQIGMEPKEVVELTNLSREQVESLWQEFNGTSEL